MPIRRLPARLLMAAALLFASTLPATARPPGGVAMMFAGTIRPLEDDAIPDPRSPRDLVSAAPASGVYEVWFHFWSRPPLVGAWTLDLAFDYDRRPGHGIDIDAWQVLADRAHAAPQWPGGGPGHGIRLEWDRPDCFDDTHADLFAGESGWFRQSALKLVVTVHGADTLRLADPEPGVPAEVVQCFDDAFRLDGEDGWTAYVAPEFTATGSAAVSAGVPPIPVRTATWSALKSGRAGARP